MFVYKLQPFDRLNYTHIMHDILSKHIYIFIHLLYYTHFQTKPLSMQHYYFKIIFSECIPMSECDIDLLNWYSLFGDSENRGNNYLKIRDLLSIALFNILGTHYLIHI
jgi:hypothetical protein